MTTEERRAAIEQLADEFDEFAEALGYAIRAARLPRVITIRR